MPGIMFTGLNNSLTFLNAKKHRNTTIAGIIIPIRPFARTDNAIKNQAKYQQYFLFFS